MRNAPRRNELKREETIMPYYNIHDLEKKREDVSPLAEIQSVVGELMKFGIVT